MKDIGTSANVSTRSVSKRWKLLAIAIGAALAGLVPIAEQWLAHKPAARASVRLEQPTREHAIDPALRPAPGDYRLAMPDELAGVRLPVSHIVISHRDAEPAFGLGTGHPREDAWRTRYAFKSTRRRAEALVIALRVAEEARANPSAFEQLARTRSDDPQTRDLGGHLGTVAIDELATVYLDALGPLHEGEVTPLIETVYGFELLKLDSPPVDDVVSGTRAVIPYQNTIGSSTDPKQLPTREQALILARAIAQQARSESKPVIEIARAREQVNEIATGFAGTWCTRDAGPDTVNASIELDVLSRLKLGAISEPVDTAYGFALLQRVNLAPPRSLAYQAIFFRFDPRLPDTAESSRARGLEMARAALSEAQRNPQRFAEFQTQYCCAGTMQLEVGLQQLELSAFLSKVAIGQLAPAIYEDFAHVAVIKRVEPQPRDRPRVRAFELPKPDAPDMALLIEHGDGPVLSKATRELTRAARARLQLGEERGQAFEALFDGLAARLERSTPGPERMTLVADTMHSAQRLLGEKLFGDYTTYMTEWTTHRMLYGN